MNNTDKKTSSWIEKAVPFALLIVSVLSASAQLTTNLPPSPIVQFWGGGQDTMVLLADGSVWTWGSNVAGKLGNNQSSANYGDNSFDSYLPVKVHGPGNVGYLNSIIAVSAGEAVNTALRADGTVWAWGDNEFAQLGNGTTNDAWTPVQVIGLTNIVGISGRGYHTLALKSDGTVWAWGWNYYGQLGIGSTATVLVPRQVLGITNPAAISACYSTSLVLMPNGTVEMWGTDKVGEMGQGGFGFHSYTPIPVPGISNVLSISGDFQEPEALKSDGSIWMWGYNNLGQLGIGTTNNTNIPMQVLNLTNMIFAGVTGDRNNCAIRTDHTVWIWGRNYNGQLGNGMTDSVAHPFPEPMAAFGNATVVAVQTPDWQSLALESDGTMWSWGSNPHGQLGNGTTNDAWSPGLVLWPVVAAPTPILLTGATLPDGSFQINFTNNPGTLFAVLTTTNLSWPMNRWTAAGTASEVAAGQFQFTESSTVTIPRRFYSVRTP
ncbi:MAG: RCC1 repeat- and reductase domain-containing protein [Verrucomicrobiota bacterium]